MLNFMLSMKRCIITSGPGKISFTSFSQNQRHNDPMTWYLASRTCAYHHITNNDFSLTLTFLTAMTTFVFYVVYGGNVFKSYIKELF